MWIWNVLLSIFSGIALLMVMPAVMMGWILLNRLVYRWFEGIWERFGG